MDKAAELISRASHDLLRTGEFVTLVEWLDALPTDLVQADSQLVTMKAWSLFLTGRYDEGAALVQAITQRLFPAQTQPSDVDSISLGRLALAPGLSPAPECRYYFYALCQAGGQAAG